MNDSVRTDMRAALSVAIKARDRIAIAALRSALGALDNAEAIDIAETAAGAAPASGSPIAGATSGLGATEATRRTLTADDVARVIAAEIDERHSAADQYERGGQAERAATLRAEADVLAAYIR